jgi:hypothetical protein
MKYSRAFTKAALTILLAPLSLSPAFAGSGSADGGNVTWSSDDSNVLTLPTGITGASIDLSGVSNTPFGNGIHYNVNDSGNSQSFYGATNNRGSVNTSSAISYYYNNSSGHATVNNLPGMVMNTNSTNTTITDTMNFNTAQTYFGTVESESSNTFFLDFSNISFYSGGTLVASMPMSSVYTAQVHGGSSFYTDATLNVNFLNGATYNEIIFSTSNTTVADHLSLMNMTDGVATIAPTQPGVAVINASSTSLGQGHVTAGATGSISVKNSTPDTTNNPGGMVDVSSVKTVNSSSGSSTNTTSITGVQITGSNSANVAATLNLSHDGANSGTATVSYVNDQTNHDGVKSTVTQTVATTVTGVGYNYAAPSTLPATIAIGAARVGGATLTGSQAITNTATNDGYSEALDVAASGLTGSLSITSPSTHITAGSSGNLGFTLTTGTSGSFSQAATVALTSNGTGIDTLGTTALTSQNVTVTGNVYQLASSSIPTVVALGKTYVGGTLAGNVGVQNTSAGGLVDTLVASSLGTTGGLSASQAPIDMVSGQTGTLQVGFSTANAGVQAGTITIGLTSHDSQLSDVSLGSETSTVIGYVYNMASSNLTAPGATPPVVSLGATRVGGAGLSASLQVQNTAPAGAFSEGLGVSQGAFTGSQFTSSGDIANLTAGTAKDLTYSLPSTASGSFSATTSLGLTSNGATTSGLGVTQLGSAPVTLTGSVYQLAQAVITAPVTDFGILHRGQRGPSTRLSMNISNVASGALVDELIATPNGATNGFSLNGGARLQAGDTANPAMQVTANTLKTGVNTGIITIGLTSHDHELADVSLGTQQVAFSDTVYDYADPSFTKVSGDGTFIDPPSYYSLDFGQVAQGTTASATMELANILPFTDSSQIYTDLLSGNFHILTGSGFDILGLRNISDLVAGGSGLDFTVDFQALATSQANYTEVLEFDGVSYDSAGRSSVSPAYLILSEGTGGPTFARSIQNIDDGTDVPEAPGILTMLVGLLGLGVFSYRRKMRSIHQA